MKKPSIPDIPGPQGAQMLRQLTRIQRDPLGFLMAAAGEYGDLVQFPIGSLMVYLANHPDYARHVLQDNHRNYTKDTIQYRQLATITGRGLLTNDGDDWLRQRRLAQPAFHKERIERLGSMIAQYTSEMLVKWEPAAASGAPVDIDEAMLQLTLRIVGKALFSIDLGQEAPTLTHAVLTALDHIVYKASNFIALPESIPTPRNLRFRRALKTLDRAVYTLIEQRRQQSQPPDDLLTMLLAARDELTGAAMTDQQVRDEVLTILIAGHETVASALTWSWYLLALHPEIQAHLAEEAQMLPDDPRDERLALPELPFTQHVFEETLRLYPPAWLITRRATQPDRLGNYDIPAGSLIIISPYVMHRHPDFWPTAEAFDPGRFAPASRKSIPRFAYLPFGGGPRLCIGDRFALYEAQWILALIARRFRLELPAGSQVEQVPLVTLRPRHGLPLQIRRR
jgi:cytochrome P450